jgi:hypothetical protein
VEGEATDTNAWSVLLNVMVIALLLVAEEAAVTVNVALFCPAGMVTDAGRDEKAEVAPE